MSENSSRRMISRHKISHEDDQKNKSDYRLNNTQSSQKSKEPESVPNSQLLSAQTVNYLNKEPFNEDTPVEESYLTEEHTNWKALVLDKLRSVIDTLKHFKNNPVENKNSIKEAYKNGIILFASLKKLNRLSQMSVNRCRVQTHEEKLKIDEHHLELQNLLYEISHLKKEINTCLEFRSVDETIDLVSVEEFVSAASAQVNQSEVMHNEHQLKLARLDWELKERQNMLNRIKDLESQIDQREKQIKLKQSKLESLHPKLNQIIDACKPTLEYFDTHFEENCMFSEQVQYLPKPLYQFYMMITAYRDTIDRDVKIEVCGDLEEAKRYNLNETINFEEDESDSDADNEGESETYKKKKSKSKSKNKKKSNFDKVFNQFPLSCKVTFSVRGFGQFALEFFYLNILKIVTVKTEMRLLKDISISDRTEFVFKNLYENDTGNESPNQTNKFLLNNLGIKSFEPYLKNIGFPYKWCQILCGLYFENRSERQEMIAASMMATRPQANEQNSEESMIVDEEKADNVEVEESSQSNFLNDTNIFEQIINRLKSRFKAKITLQEAITSLKNSVVPYAESFTNLRFKVQSSVFSFKETSYEKFFGPNYAKHLQEIGIDENHWSFYELNLKNQSASLQSQIAVHQDYPRISPLFAISINWKHERNFLNDEAIRDMEREINLFKDNFMIQEDVDASKTFRRSLSGNGKHAMEEKNYDILSRQINHLMICFDVYLESEAFYLNDPEFHRLKLFPNSVRGRDRKRPYSYLANKDLFLQRMKIDFGSE